MTTHSDQPISPAWRTELGSWTTEKAKPIHLVDEPWSTTTRCGIKHPDRQGRDCPFMGARFVDEVDRESWAAKGRPFVVCEACAAGVAGAAVERPVRELDGQLSLLEAEGAA